MLELTDYHPPSDLLKGRAILVTGAGEGIGRAAALSFAQYGATVLLLGRTLEKLEAVYDEIEKAGGAQPALLPLNLSSASMSDYTQMAQMIEEQIGRLDGILHNAAMLGPLTPLQMYDPDTWDDVMNVNLRAPFQMTQTLLPLLRQSPDASVLFTTSSVGRTARAFWGAYAISKCGIEGLAKIFSDELANVSSIRFNCINPGATRTNMRAHAYPGENPMNLPTPEQIMPSYLYLMGADSQGITGHSIDAIRPV
ncbi:MAG: YciK family oxidoreductase [Pseudomonadota bacterium]|nr:YciK family oxidoreductase [Pseudomonadota bacterium]